VFLWIKHAFEEQGYSVWMDVDHMSSSVLEAMAAAVEEAVVVVRIFLTVSSMLGMGVACVVYLCHDRVLCII
jgi:hypothetical protein